MTPSFLVEIGRSKSLGDRIVEEMQHRELEVVHTLQRTFGSRVPIHLFYNIGKIDALTNEDYLRIEADFFDGERQIKYNIERHQQRDGSWHLRLKRAHYRRLYVTLRGVDYPLVLAADYPEGRSIVVAIAL